MIQFNTSLAATKSASSGSIVNPDNQASSTSFDSELSAALTQSLTSTLQKFGIDPSKFSISIAPVTTDKSQPKAASTASATASTQAQAQAAPQAAADATADPIKKADDAYWAKQPDAVKALREIQDPMERANTAAELASQGFTIDVPIMVWGWDASKVTDLRKSYGYTWVPSAYQQPVAMAPGIFGVGSNPYDPNNPPQGSITV